MSGPLKQVSAIAPQLDCRVISIAENQAEYMTVYGALVTMPGFPAPHGWNAITLAFRLDDEHKQAIAAGSDIYVTLLTFGKPMQPILVQVDKASAAAAFGVEVLPSWPR